MASTHTPLLLAAVALLVGCGASSTAPDPQLGASVRHNRLVQTINPDPVYDGDAFIMADRPVLAVERYRTDKVESPADTGTSEVGRSSAAADSPSRKPD